VTSFSFLTIQVDLTMTAAKKTETKIATLKGQEGKPDLRKLISQAHVPWLAEDTVLQYLKRVSRARISSRRTRTQRQSCR
jgi:hypothetical protein